MNMDFRESGCKDERWEELTHDHVQQLIRCRVQYRCYTLQETVSSGSMRAYVLEPSGPGGHLVIHSVQADGLTHLQQSNSYFLQSW